MNDYEYINIQITYCELLLPAAESLCRALEVNQFISIDMKNNNLPDILLKNPRYIYIYICMYETKIIRIRSESIYIH
jgi:hypothetical protein